MPYIFISHSTVDTEFSRYLTRALEAEDFDIWVDFDDIHSGQRWVKAIQDAVEGCAAMVIVMSRKARDSEWVEREALLAMDLKKPIHIALIEDIPLPLHLINRQFTNFLEDHEVAVKALAGVLRDLDLNAAAPRKVPTVHSTEPNQYNFFAYLAQLPGGEQNTLIAQDLYHWGQGFADSVEFGGKITPGFHVRKRVGEDDLTLFSVWAYPRRPAVQVQFQYLAEVPPYTDAALRRSTLASLNKLLDEPLLEDKADRRPTLPLTEALNTADKLEAFKQVMQEVLDNLQSV